MSEQMEIVKAHLDNAVESLHEAFGNWASPTLEIQIDCIRASIRELQENLNKIEEIDSKSEDAK